MQAEGLWSAVFGLKRASGLECRPFQMSNHDNTKYTKCGPSQSRAPRSMHPLKGAQQNKWVSVSKAGSQEAKPNTTEIECIHKN